MLVTTRKLLKDAQAGGYAVGGFNTNNLEITKAIVEAAVEMSSPVIVQTSSGAIKYAGIEELAGLVKAMARKADVPIALHLDHCTDLKLVGEALGNGYTSIMFDGSGHSFPENVKLTKKAVAMAHRKRVPVEGELGQLKGVEDEIKGRDLLTRPEEAERFVKLTGIDSLAIAIGTSHGAYKFKGTPKLDFERLEHIRNLVDVPLVLHGASGIPEALVKEATKYGAVITGAKGVPDAQIRKAISLGICKINIDSDLRLAFDVAVRRFLKEHPGDIDPRGVLGAAMEKMKEIVISKIKLFGSKGRC